VAHRCLISSPPLVSVIEEQAKLVETLHAKLFSLLSPLDVLPTLASIKQPCDSRLRLFSLMVAKLAESAKLPHFVQLMTLFNTSSLTTSVSN
jgi:hypothetical protein